MKEHDSEDYLTSLYKKNKKNIIEFVSHLQREVIVHSIIYYNLNKNVISDYKYDILAKKLVFFQKKCEDIEKTKYYYATKGFDGNTGCDLFSKLNNNDTNWLYMIAESVVNSYENDKMCLKK